MGENRKNFFSSVGEGYKITERGTLGRGVTSAAFAAAAVAAVAASAAASAAVAVATVAAMSCTTRGSRRLGQG
jgi:hypothetical protein